MPESPLKQLLRDRPARDSSSSLPVPEAPPTSPSVVSRTKPFMLDFQLLNGNHVALPYTSLLFLSFNPSKQIVAMFATHTVTITGVCLMPIYEALLDESVGTLKAIGERVRHPSDGIPIVYSIESAQRTGDMALPKEPIGT
jgi:hypothetical protein